MPTGPARYFRHRQATKRRDERSPWPPRPRSPRPMGRGIGQERRPWDVQPRRRKPVHRRRTAGRERQRRPAHERATQPRRPQSDVPRDAGIRTIGQPQRVTGHHGGRPRRWTSWSPATGHAVTGGGTLLPMSRGHPPSLGGPPLPRRVRQPHRANRCTSDEPNDSPPPRNVSCSTRATAAARSPAAPPRPTTAKSTTAAPTGPTADSPTSTTKRWPAARQPPRQTRRLDHPQTQRRPHRMDPATQPRYRPSPRQQLPPPPALPHPRRTQRDRRRRRRRSGRYLGLEELQQVGVDDVGMSGRHAVRKVLVGLQNSVGQKLG